MSDDRLTSLQIERRRVYIYIYIYMYVCIRVTFQITLKNLQICGESPGLASLL